MVVRWGMKSNCGELLWSKRISEGMGTTYTQLDTDTMLSLGSICMVQLKIYLRTINDLTKRNFCLNTLVHYLILLVPSSTHLLMFQAPSKHWSFHYFWAFRLTKTKQRKKKIRIIKTLFPTREWKKHLIFASIKTKK